MRAALAIMVMCGYVGCASIMMTALSWSLTQVKLLPLLSSMSSAIRNLALSVPCQANKILHLANRPANEMTKSEQMKRNVYGLGRSRDKKGDWVGVHLNPYVNCIHTLAGGGFETMMVLIVEVYE